MPYPGMNPGEFPHSEICGSTLICSSPQLIAAYHVFLRLPVPRHSPCALLRLTINASLEFLPPTALSLFYSNCQQDLCSLPVETVVSSLEVLLNLVSQLLFSSQGTSWQLALRGGPKWTRTIDLTIISRVL